jgi:hypothetical protein
MYSKINNFIVVLKTISSILILMKTLGNVNFIYFFQQKN